MYTFVSFALSLSSPIDRQVKVISRNTQDGRQELVFNDYCYQKLNNPALSERRTRAMVDILAQASNKLAETNDYSWSVRMYSRGQNGLTPRLHIANVTAVQGGAGAPTDIQKQLVDFSTKAVELDIDMSAMPNAAPEVQLGWLKAKVAMASTRQAQHEVVASDAPPTEGNADDLPF